jgi:hypothetical protein
MNNTVWVVQVGHDASGDWKWTDIEGGRYASLKGARECLTRVVDADPSATLRIIERLVVERVVRSDDNEYHRHAA